MYLLMVTWLHRRNIAWNPRLSLTRELAVFNSSLSELTVVNSSLAVFNSSPSELAVFNSSPSELTVFIQFILFYSVFSLYLYPSRSLSIFSLSSSIQRKERSTPANAHLFWLHRIDRRTWTHSRGRTGVTCAIARATIFVLAETVAKVTFWRMITASNCR